MKKLSVDKAIEMIEQRREAHLRRAPLHRKAGLDFMANEALLCAAECEGILNQLRNYGKPALKLTIPKGIIVTTSGWVDKKPRRSRGL